MRRGLVAGIVAAAAIAASFLALIALRGCGDEEARPPDATGTRTTSTVPKHGTRPGPRAPRPGGGETPATGWEDLDAPGGAQTPPAKPTFDVRVLVDGTDEPVAGVVVNARPVRGGSSAARTDETGRAHLKDVDPGLVAVSVESSESRRDLAPPAGVLVRTDRECVLRMPRAPVLRGRVELPAGTTADLVAVRYRAGGVAIDNRTIRLDPQGAFAEPVRPGRYLVWISGSGADGVGWARAPVEVVAPGGPELLLRPRPAPTLTGTVTGEGIGLGEGDRAMVFALPSDGPPIEGLVPRFVRAIPGTFEWVPPDPDRDTDLWVRVGPSASPATGWGIARRVRSDSRSVEVVVRPAWTLRITAVDVNGHALASPARCVVAPEGWRTDASPLHGAAGESSPEGVLTATGLPPSDMAVTVSDPRSDTFTQRVRVPAWTPSITVTVTAGATVSGRVVADDGSTIEIGDVHAGADTDLRVADVGDEGKFRLVGMVPGRARLRWVVDSALSIDLGEVDVPSAGDVTLKVPISR